MGADFILEVFELPDNTTPTEMHDALMLWTQLQPIGRLREIYDEAFFGESALSLTPAELRAQIKTALDLLIEYRRDVTWTLIGGHHQLLTGGMSWGDSPTEAMPYLNFLNELAWARERDQSNGA